MIYVGLLRFNDQSTDENKLCSVLASYTPSPTVIQKNFLTLCHTDEVWDDASTLLMGRIFGQTRHDFKMDKEALRKVWGKYIYIQANPERSQFEVVIDSTGQLPFFYYVFSNGDILFSSHVEIIFKVLSQKPEINWAYLCSYIVYGNSSAIETPFKNISELPPGCCLKITKSGQETEPFWSPPAVTTQNNGVEVLKATLKPLIEPYNNICVSLSGGLDSSSLVYCLKEIKREDQTLSAINYYHSAVQSSNETVHARAVCRETGIDLIEIDLSETLPFSPYSKPLSIKPNKPAPGLLSLRWKENVSDRIPTGGSSIFLSGHGSDHIFMHPPPKTALSDYVLERGLNGSQTVLKKLTHFYRDSIFSILKENTKSLLSYFFYGRFKKRDLKNETAEWINQCVHQHVSPRFIHPIYNHLPSRMSPGKYLQVDALYEGLASIHGEMHQFHPTCYPFLYAPMVEFALSIPTYELFDKGYDRYPLRKAVSDHFKTEKVWRRDKSQTTGVMQLGVKKNLQFLLDLCLEGEFVKQGFVDKEGLRKAIVLIGSGDDENLWPFMHIASCEMFLRYWAEKSG